MHGGGKKGWGCITEKPRGGDSEGFSEKRGRGGVREKEKE